MTGVRERAKRRKAKIEAEAAEKVQKEIESQAVEVPTRRKRKRRKQTNEEELVVEQKPKTKKKVKQERSIRARPTRRPVPADRVEVEEAENVDSDGTLPTSISRILEGSFLFDLMQALDVNQAVTIVRKDEDVWKLVVGGLDTVNNALRLSGTAYEEEVWSDEYKEHVEEWDVLSHEEKIDTAIAAGVIWEEHETGRINLMRCTDAYRKSQKLEKYKPQYRTYKARKAIRSS